MWFVCDASSAVCERHTLLYNGTWLIYRLLENEIQQLQKETAAKESEFCRQIEHLKKENTRQQKLIVQVCCCGIVSCSMNCGNID